MTTLNDKWPSLVDLTSRLDPNGAISAIAEILNETNEVLDDVPWYEGNLPTGHRSSIRSGIPDPTWRKLYGGVQPTKSRTVPVTDTVGMLEAYAEVDKALADLNGNTRAFRLSEDRAHIEGISQAVTDALFYGDTDLTPERFLGLAPRFDLSTAENGSQIVKGDGAGADNTSVWLVVWGEDKVFGLYPKGSKAGLQVEDKGQVTIESVDGAGGRMEAYRSHYRWDCGLVVKDWRYIVRVCNLDISALTKDAATGSDLVDLMTQALELVPNLQAGRAVFYCNRTIRSFLRRQIKNAKNINLTLEQVAGKRVVAFDGVPVRRCDAILNSEAVIA